MKKFDTTYTEAMDRLVLTTVGIYLVEPSSTRQVATLLGLLRKLVRSCLELAAGEPDGSTESGYTWEEKIESLIKLAKAVGRFTNTDRGTEGYKVTREYLFAAYDEFCEWRHDEPYVVDEITALIQSGQSINKFSGTCTGYIDDITSTQMLIGMGDTSSHPAIHVSFPKDCTLSIEQMNGAISRLRRRAGITYEQFPDLVVEDEDDFLLDVLCLISETERYDKVYWVCHGEYAPITFFVQCLDLFYEASVDTGRLMPEDLPALRQAIADVKEIGASIEEGSVEEITGYELWLARKRGMRPYQPAYPKDARLRALFDACGPARTPDEESLY